MKEVALATTRQLSRANDCLLSSVWPVKVFSSEMLSFVSTIFEDSMTPANTVCKRRKEEEQNGNTMEEVNFVRVHCMYIQNYHSDTPYVMNVY
jgi:hypothetical protein